MRKIILLTLFTFFLNQSFCRAEEEIFSSQQKETIIKIVNDYLMKNPETLISVIEQWQKKQLKAEENKNKELIQKNATSLFQNPNDFVAGNRQGKIALVIFMDPYCGHCRRFHRVIDQAIDLTKDTGIKELKVIYKDLPIFGDNSNIAVRAILAAQKQGKYLAFQQEMFKEDKSVNEEEIKNVARRLGLDSDQLLKDMSCAKIKSIVADTLHLAETLGINGTPTLVIGDKLIPGEINLKDLKELVDQYQK